MLWKLSVKAEALGMYQTCFKVEFFWDIVWPWFIACFWCFGTTYQLPLQMLGCQCTMILPTLYIITIVKSRGGQTLFTSGSPSSHQQSLCLQHVLAYNATSRTSHPKDDMLMEYTRRDDMTKWWDGMLCVLLSCEHIAKCRTCATELGIITGFAVLC